MGAPQNLVFAARTPQSRHDPGEFIVGNVFTDTDIAARLDAYRFYDRHQMGANPTCRSCGVAGHSPAGDDELTNSKVRCYVTASPPALLGARENLIEHIGSAHDGVFTWAPHGGGTAGT